jgi:hypothetical protein
MSDGGRGRASLGMEGLKSSQKWSAQRSGVRSIAWLDLDVTILSPFRSPKRPLVVESIRREPVALEPNTQKCRGDR